MWLYDTELDSVIIGPRQESPESERKKEPLGTEAGSVLHQGDPTVLLKLSAD